ncbi:hypothetical protein [Paraclostridium sordellii]|uniref:Uncharacterized protein n=2 Tax=Paraclostridium sordellii TaxID=1505 RepID=A0A0C7Q417_PARSO|nr:hypothetical protein [Paeniclostridium sordellii]MDU4414461.1 hypothetical protein [Paeniclostridium sordellii]QYE99508.1 hypothetical protein KZ987_08435 [Paeniclostridium sordellii]CEN78311.1 Uncharacterised protein [[Clostridium] sordellii] [Paeniclostridium sordellii]CEO08235.1 Uncharacterised protein [[Clostridium] sordellii] [Paeniclostridium sordellii]CEO34737.1 Uncharacterised protein [[Clostridium] sordellii] [Paeniclostridium sordellii]
MNKSHKKILGSVLSLLFLMSLLIIVNAKNPKQVNINNSQKTDIKISQAITDENLQKTNALYKKGIEFGAIDPSEVSKEDWQKQEKDYRENYDTAIKEGILQDITYEQWLEENNYGQFPKADPEIFDEFIIPPQSQENKK